MTILATFLINTLELPTRRALALIVIVSLSVGVLLAGDDQPPAPPPDGTGWLPSSSEGLPQPLVRAVRASPHAFFRLANRAWASRVCAAFVNDVRSLDLVRLHGDAHVEQYAVTDSSTVWTTSTTRPRVRRSSISSVFSDRYALRRASAAGPGSSIASPVPSCVGTAGLTELDDASTYRGAKVRRRTVPLAGAATAPAAGAQSEPRSSGGPMD